MLKINQLRTMGCLITPAATVRVTVPTASTMATPSAINHARHTPSCRAHHQLSCRAGIDERRVPELESHDAMVVF